jgi:tetratricopeptide (TPR) repeat protein
VSGLLQFLVGSDHFFDHWAYLREFPRNVIDISAKIDMPVQRIEVHGIPVRINDSRVHFDEDPSAISIDFGGSELGALSVNNARTTASCCYVRLHLNLDDLIEDLPVLRERIRRNRSDAESLHTLGVMLTTRGEDRRSFICHRAAAVSRPESAKYLYHSGSAALAIGRTGDAAWYLDRALSINPNCAEAWQARGRLYLDDLKKPDEALRSYIRAIELEPKDPANYRSAARCVLAGHGHGPGLSVARIRDAMPPGVDALNTALGLALAMIDAGCYESASSILHDIVRQRPDDRTSMRALTEVCTGLRDWRAAQSWYERALAAGNDTLAMIGYVLHWSRLGDFERARELYRSHSLGGPFQNPVGPGVRRWHGQDIRGKTLRLIAGDRYFGDALQYSRFAHAAKEAGAGVILQCPKRLRSLLRTVPGVDSAVAPHDHIPAVDYEAVAFWLLWELSVPIAEMFGKIPYLQAPADLREQWKRRIAPTAGINVGIVWQGSSYLIHDRFRNRSMSIEDLRPLGASPGVTLYSLQCGEGRTELSNASPPFPAIDLAPDFPNTAAAIEALDLVVTIDTSIAHLAGALGKRTFLMLPYSACFRWMEDRDDTPWYPAMRLFRQTRPGEWSDVVAAVVRELRPLALEQ